jgi:hypothetical protein
MKTRDLIPTILKGWFKLLANPPREPCAWAHKTNTAPGQKPDLDHGYFKLRGEVDPANPNSTKDDKDVLHVRGYLRQLLERDNWAFLAEHDELIGACEELLRRNLAAIHPVLHEVDRRFGTDLARRLYTLDDDHVVRLLAYRGVRSDSVAERIIGQGHRDRSGSTTTVLETKRGVQIMTPDGWKDIRSSELDLPNFFNSAKIDIATNGRLAALPHRIVDYSGPDEPGILEHFGLELPPGIVRVSFIVFTHYDGIVIPPGYQTRCT